MSTDDDRGSGDQDLDLVVSGLIYLEQAGDVAIEVRRGMVILTAEGREAGKVAAVIIGRQPRQVTHVLLGRLRQALEYRQVPLELIERVQEDRVLLRVVYQFVDSLPKWRGT